MIDRDQFLDLLDRLALNGEIEEPESYSGRAMYGKQCVAVMSESSSEWSFAIAMGWLCRCEGLDARDIPEPRVDSMGRGYVLYWPQYEWPEDRQCPSRREDEDED